MDNTVDVTTCESTDVQPNGLKSWRVFFRIYRCEPTNNSDLSDGWAMDERWISDGWAMVNTVDVSTCHEVV